MGKTSDKTVYKTTGWCGFGSGSNPAAVDVKNGKIVRIRPMHLDKEYSQDELNPWKIEAHGHTLDCGTVSSLSPMGIGYKKRVYSHNRVPYPLKRVDWDPDGERHPETRGTSKYERISWDEATEIIAKELRRVIDTYGNKAVFVKGDGHGETKVMHAGHGASTHLMNLLGGFTLEARQPDSWEGWYWGAKHMWGQDPVGQQAHQSNLLNDISQNSDAVIFVGCDPETTPWGWGGQMASRISYFWSECGIKSIYICPDLNYGAAVHADKWIAPYPNTDAALWLGIAWVWLTEDTYDHDYIATHTDGFDWFKDYVLGGADGQPKTPKWAESKCGVPSRDIKALARYWATHKVSTAHCNGGGYIRSAYSTEPARLEVALLAMQGLGAPGKNMFKMMEWGLFGMPELNPIPAGEWGTFMWAGFTGHVAGTDLDHFIPQTLVPDAITLPEGEKLTWYGRVIAGLPRSDQFVQYQYPEEDGTRIHMIWDDTPCWSTCWNGGNRMEDALRHPSIEFYLVEHPWMENDTLFADIILPVSTKYEESDIATSSECGINDMVVDEEQAIDPVGEAKSDTEIALAIADKLGVKDELWEHWVYPDVVAAQGATINEDDARPIDGKVAQGAGKEDKTGNNFVVEQKVSTEHVFGEPGWDSLKLRAYTLGGCQQHEPYEEFLKKGYLPVRFKDDWKNDPVGLQDFYYDPVNHPIDTPTGKIEFYATGIHDVWPDDPERPEVPHWIEEGESHHERLTNDRGKDYPFLVVSNHPRWRVHAEGDDITWLREIETCKVKGPDGYLYEPVWINPNDARKLGIKGGDVVRIFNERGSVLGGALLTERIREHVISQDHGARVDSIVAGQGGLDRGGANNLICPGNTTSKNAPGEVTNGFLANIEKVDPFALAMKYPEAFSKDYEPADGMQATDRIVK